MTGPERKLPPLRVQIRGDASHFKKTLADSVQAAKDAQKEIAKTPAAVAKANQKEFNRQFNNMRLLDKANKTSADREIQNYRLLRRAKESENKEFNRRNRALDNAYRKERTAADKKAEATTRQEQAKTVSFFRNKAKGLNTDASTNLGRLTPAFRGMRPDTPTRGGDLNALVRKAEQGARSAHADRIRRMKGLDKSAKQTRTQEDRDARKSYVNRLRETGNTLRQNLKNDDDARKSRRREYVERLRESGNTLRQNLKNDDAARKSRRQDYVNRLRETGTLLRQNLKNDDDARKSRRRDYVSRLRETGTLLRQNLKNDDDARKASADAQEKKAKTLQRIQDHFAKVNKERLQSMGRDLTMQNNRDIQSQRESTAARRRRLQALGRDLSNQHRNDLAAIRETQRVQRQQQRRSRGPAFGSDMGTRADIFMHAAAIKSTAGTIVSFLKPAAELENYALQMRAFTGSAETAKATIATMQEFALVSPYSMTSVMKATTLLMKYGQSADSASSMVQMLGDVAAGDSHKLELLTLGVAQTMRIGKLMGQELRQMTEHGFNPLNTAAKQIAGPGASEEQIQKVYQDLSRRMRKGQISSGLVAAALKTETSEGGMFAGMVTAQSKSIQGLATQIVESIELIKITIGQMFEEELRDLLKWVLKYITDALAWVKANKELVKSYVIVAVKVLAAIMAFSALAAALATLRWIITSVMTVFAAFRILIVGYNILVGIATGLSVAWGLATGAVAVTFGSVATAIAAVIGALVILTFLFKGLTHKDGFTGVVKDWASGFMWFAGFMWNIGENMTMMWDFVIDNWKLIVVDFLIFFMDQMLMIPEVISGIDLSGRMRAAIVGDEEYKSNFKTDFGMPDLKGGLEGMLSFLNPFLPQDVTKQPDAAPNIDFKKFIGPGGLGGDDGWGKSGPEAAPDHARIGTADHAVRMWKYEQSIRPEIAADKAEEDPAKKQVSLLTAIEKNTRCAPPRGGEILADAGIATAAMVPGI